MLLLLEVIFTSIFGYAAYGCGRSWGDERKADEGCNEIHARLFLIGLVLFTVAAVFFACMSVVHLKSMLG